MAESTRNTNNELIAPGSSQFVSAASLRQRLDWLNRLRWAAVVVVVGAALIAGLWLGLPLPMRGLVISAAGLLVLNCLYVLRNQRWAPTDIKAEIRFVKVQMVGDLVILTELLNLTGGIENPFFFIYVIHVILASLLFKGREIYQIAGLAIVLFTGEVMGEYLDVLPHHHLLSAGDLTHELPFLLTGLGAFWLVMLTCAYLGASIMKHNRTIKDELVERQSALVEADAEKMEFFRYVTHEVKSPVSTAQSAVEAALELEGDGLSEQVRGLLTRGLARLEQTNLMVRDLADLTRGGELQQGEITELDVGELVTRVVGRLGDLADQRGVGLAWTTPPAPVMMRVNSNMLEKVVANLVGNGIRYSAGQGEVTVSLATIADGISFIVKDQGIGIPAADQERVFDEFFRTESAREVSRLGTGLGLAIVHKFVGQMGAEISLRSEVGVGSEFTVLWRHKDHRTGKIK